jgi:hypothetical protein
MKRLAVVTSLLSLVAVWVVLIPMGFMFYQFPPDKTLAHFQRFGARFPFSSGFLLHNLTMGRLYVLALLVSAAIIWLGARAQKNARLFAGQASLVAGWCSVVAAVLLWFFMPLFKMHEVVVGGYEGTKSKFTQIQFITDSLRPSANQLFMQREGDNEVAITSAEGERWVNVEVASGTNKAFVIVYADPPQPTNTPFGQFSYWWPRRVVEISLPMTNQPLTNYTVRTLWTCKPTGEVVKGDLIPCYINSTWDGMYLMVHSRVYGVSTNPAEWEMATRVYDVEMSKFMTVPPTAP